MRTLSGLALVLVATTAFGSEETPDPKKYEEVVTTCELSALHLGTEIADIFNAPAGNEDATKRLHQDKIIEKLGFTPGTVKGIPGTNGRTLEGHDAREIFDKAGWNEKNISASPYAHLNNKWVYMIGDSTTRQLWESFASLIEGNNFGGNAKQWTRNSCDPQTHRKRHPDFNGVYDEEGWRGACGLNEVTCHVPGYGANGLLSYDWKHFPYEDYDEYLFGPEGPFMKGFPGKGLRRPDVLTVQFGIHSCFHADPEGQFSKHLTAINTVLLDMHLQNIPKLMQAIRRAIDHDVVLDAGVAGTETQQQTRTSVVVITSGSTFTRVGGISIDACVRRFNRAATTAAHEAGFVVLDRGEIEHRLMHKSDLAKNPILLGDIHLPPPGPSLVSTCLLHLMKCMSKAAAHFKINA